MALEVGLYNPEQDKEPCYQVRYLHISELFNMDETRRKIFTAALPIGAVALAATAANAQVSAPMTTQSLTSVINTFVPGLGGFVGTFTLTGVQVINGVLSAVGTLAGNVLGQG